MIALKQAGMLLLQKSLIKIVTEDLLQKQLDKIPWHEVFGVQIKLSYWFFLALKFYKLWIIQITWLDFITIKNDEMWYDTKSLWKL